MSHAPVVRVKNTNPVMAAWVRERTGFELLVFELRVNPRLPTKPPKYWSSNTMAVGKNTTAFHQVAGVRLASVPCGIKPGRDDLVLL